MINHFRATAGAFNKNIWNDLVRGKKVHIRETDARFIKVKSVLFFYTSNLHASCGKT